MASRSGSHSISTSTLGHENKSNMPLNRPREILESRVYTNTPATQYAGAVNHQYLSKWEPAFRPSYRREHPHDYR